VSSMTITWRAPARSTPARSTTGQPTLAVRPPSRPLRAALAATVATACGALGHMIGGGTLSAAVLALAWGAAAIPAWLLTGRERSWAWIAGLQVGTQLLVHTALSATTAHAAGHHHAIPPEVMFCAHVVAGLLTAVALRVGERRLWAGARRLAARMARWRHRLTDPPAGPFPPPPLLVPAPGPAPRFSGGLLRHVVVRRGPPPGTT
jgi:hypothetical protein